MLFNGFIRFLLFKKAVNLAGMHRKAGDRVFALFIRFRLIAFLTLLTRIWISKSPHNCSLCPITILSLSSNYPFNSASVTNKFYKLLGCRVFVCVGEKGNQMDGMDIGMRETKYHLFLFFFLFFPGIILYFSHSLKEGKFSIQKEKENFLLKKGMFSFLKGKSQNVESPNTS